MIQEGEAGVLSQVLNVEQVWTSRSQITAGREKIKVQTLETKAYKGDLGAIISGT